jgi:hypothetical protein
MRPWRATVAHDCDLLPRRIERREYDTDVLFAATDHLDAASPSETVNCSATRSGWDRTWRYPGRTRRFRCRRGSSARTEATGAEMLETVHRGSRRGSPQGWGRDRRRGQGRRCRDQDRRSTTVSQNFSLGHLLLIRSVVGGFGRARSTFTPYVRHRPPVSQPVGAPGIASSSAQSVVPCSSAARTDARSVLQPTRGLAYDQRRGEFAMRLLTSVVVLSFMLLPRRPARPIRSRRSTPSRRMAPFR